mmetsp:Transcript_32213/g.51652  ORF Transcript_32213/g.51652 Transcript_32213/m.51652 type:complete len:308 (-) Transcript_32213:12-935(-)
MTLPLPVKNLKINRKRANLHYVVAVDDSKCSRHAFAWADFIANKQDKMSIIHSFDNDIQMKCVSEMYSKFPKQNQQRYRFQVLDDEDQTLDQRIKHFVNAGKKESVDLLVTGLWGRGFEENNTKSHIGSTSDLSLRAARCSSFFVRKGVPIPENQADLRIMVGVDGSQNSLHSFEFATRLLAPNNSLCVVHVKTEYTKQADIPEQYRSANVIQNYTKCIEEAKQRLGFKFAVKITMIEDTVQISDALSEYALKNKCQIVCVGADGMTAHCNNKPILGSVSDECVKRCKCNIIVTQINEYNATPYSHK